MADANREALLRLVQRSVEWMNWCASEGLAREDFDPVEHLCAYTEATDDEEWGTLAERLPDLLERAFAAPDKDRTSVDR
ncbi:MAG: hypothetical protein AAF311_16400 [Pseudomonadota bacterium]